MSSHFSVIQYVPDPTADERMNIGVLTWDDDCVYSKFVSDFSRARTFSGKSVGFLQEFATYVSGHTGSKVRNYGEFAPAHIETLITTWTDSIQFTSPRGSTQSAIELIAELPLRFLHLLEATTESLKPKTSQTRATAIKVAYKCMRDAANIRAPHKRMVKKKLSLPGKFNEQHLLDLGFVNGHVFGAVNALSFGLASRVTLQREIDQTAWIFDDIRKRTEKLPLAVYIARNGRDEKLFETTERTFQGLKSEVITKERKMIDWADSLLKKKLAVTADD